MICGEEVALNNAKTKVRDWKGLSLALRSNARHLNGGHYLVTHKLEAYSAEKAFSAAAIVSAMSLSLWAADTNPASNAEGPR
jgi:hypothetical protein